MLPLEPCLIVLHSQSIPLFIVCTSIPFSHKCPTSYWFQSWGPASATTVAAIPLTQERMA